MTGVVNQIIPCNNLMSELQQPLISKQPGSGSPGDQTQERKEDQTQEPKEDQTQEPKAVSNDGQSFDEARFLQVLEKLKDPPGVTVKDLKSPVKCSCSCRLGVIVGLEDGSVVLVGLDAEIKVLGQHQEEVTDLCAANGTIVSGSYDETVRIWDLEQKKQLAVLGGHTSYVRCVSISADGKHIVSGSDDHTVRIWDFAEKKQLAVLEGHTSLVSCVSISADGKHIVSGSGDGTVRIWDLEEKKQLAVLQGHSGYVRCVSISSDGKHIVSGSSDKTVRIWDLEGKKQLAVLEGHTSGITCVSISSDGKHIVSGSDDKTVRIWDLEEKKQLAVLEGHTSGITCLSCSADGKHIVSGSGDRTVRIWDLEEKKQLAVLEGHDDVVRCVSVSADGKHIFSGSGDGTVRIWDSEEEKQLAVLEGHTYAVTCVSISADGKHIVSGSDDKTVRIWDLEEKKQLAVLEGHTSGVTCLSISSDRKHIVSGSWDQTVRIWDLYEKKQLAVLEGHTSGVSCVSISPDGKHIVSGAEDNTVRIWDLYEKKQLAVLEGHTSGITCLSISSDGKHIVSGSGDGTVQIWDLYEKKQLAVLEGHTSYVICVSISSDGKHIVSGSEDKTVRIWDLEEKKQIAVLEGHSARVSCVSISAYGKHIVSGSNDSTVRIWDLEEKKQLAVLEGHTSAVSCVSISADGKHIVSGSWDETVRIWDLYEKKQIAVLEGHSTGVTCVSILADGKHIVSGSPDMTIHIIDLVKIHPLRFSLLTEVFSSGELPPSKTWYNYGKYQEEVQQGTPIACAVLTSPILPHYFNSLHICAFYNKFEALKSYLEQGVSLIRGVFGSPLTIALEKNTTKCIDVILKYLTSTIEEKSSFFNIQAIVDDFPKLLLCNVPSLVDFFRSLLGKPTQTLPDFLVPLRELPHINFQGPAWVHLPDFAQITKDGQLVKLNEQTVEFLISRFDWNFELGSASSLAFLRALEDCSYRKILTTPLVTLLVQSKWERLLPITLIHTLLYVFSLLCLVGLTFNYWRPEVLNIVFICLNMLFLLYEGVQSLANGTDYWKDVWNYLDLIRGLTSVIWGYLVFREVGQLYYLHFLVVSLCFLRGFTFFRTFKMTRVFVRMVLEVVKEMYAFLVILAYSTCSFGMMYAVLMPEQISSVSGAWTTAYELLMGTHDEADFDLVKWLCFTAASLVNVIIMLNLLISILGDAYEKAQMSASENDNLEMLKLIIEYESMFFWRRKIGKPKVMLVCKSVGEEDEEDEWAGKINNIKKALEKNLKESDIAVGKKLEDNRSALEKLEEKLEENRRVMGEMFRVILQEIRTVRGEISKKNVDEEIARESGRSDQASAIEIGSFEQARPIEFDRSGLAGGIAIGSSEQARPIEFSRSGLAGGIAIGSSEQARPIEFGLSGQAVAIELDLSWEGRAADINLP